MNTTPLTTHDGLTLQLRAWPVAGARGTVVIVHGLGEHIARHANVAARLNDAGWNVLGCLLKLARKVEDGLLSEALLLRAARFGGHQPSRGLPTVAHASVGDMGYLGLLPCLTANTVNPFSFNNGDR